MCGTRLIPTLPRLSSGLRLALQAQRCAVKTWKRFPPPHAAQPHGCRCSWQTSETVTGNVTKWEVRDSRADVRTLPKDCAIDVQDCVQDTGLESYLTQSLNTSILTQSLSSPTCPASLQRSINPFLVYPHVKMTMTMCGRTGWKKV